MSIVTKAVSPRTRRVGKGALRAVPTIFQMRMGLVGTRSLSSSGASRRPVGFAHPTVSRFQRAGKMPLQHRARDGVGLLQVDAPIFQLVERYPRIGHRAAHIGSRRYHAEIAIEILHLRLAMARGTEFIQHG